MSFIRDFWGFLLHRKKLWLLPVILAILMVAGLLVATSGTVLAPFIYTLF